MEKSKNLVLWVETGYNLFSEEGLEGVQVERLARITNLNKSGFYHYFGDFEGYYDQLLKLHESIAERFLHGLLKAKNIDPDFFHLLVEFKVPVMFQMRLTQIKNKPAFYKLAEMIHEREDVIIKKLWSDYLGVHGQSDMSIRYFSIVRDMFYARISFQNFSYPYLQKLLGEAKAVMNQLAEEKALETDESIPLK